MRNTILLEYCPSGLFTIKPYIDSKMVNLIAESLEKSKGGEIGIIGRSYQDARYTMVEGPFGILRTAKESFVPTWQPHNRRLIWPNGVVGIVFGSDQADVIRGYSWSFAWVGESCPLETRDILERNLRP